jgi:hypothetical protein
VVIRVADGHLSKHDIRIAINKGASPQGDEKDERPGSS